jgi:hypothetical protein
MQIFIEPAKGNRFQGTLLIDGEVIETTLQQRPGCCARTLMNKLMLLYGKPLEPITLEIEGW